MAAAPRRTESSGDAVAGGSGGYCGDPGGGGGAAGVLHCFCDCMKNQCMTLGAGADKFDCAAACTEGCAQIGQPGQPRADDFCGLR